MATYYTGKRVFTQKNQKKTGKKHFKSYIPFIHQNRTRYKNIVTQTKTMGVATIAIESALEGYDIYKTFFANISKEKRRSFDMFFVLTTQMKDITTDPQSISDKLSHFLDGFEKTTSIKGQMRINYKSHRFEVVNSFSYVEDEIINEIAGMRFRDMEARGVSDIHPEYLYEPTVASFNIYEFFEEKPLEDKQLEVGFELLNKLKEYCIDNLNVLNPKINVLIYSNDPKFISQLRVDLKDEDVYDSTNVEKVFGIQVTNLDANKTKKLITIINTKLSFAKKFKYAIKERL